MDVKNLLALVGLGGLAYWLWKQKNPNTPGPLDWLASLFPGTSPTVAATLQNSIQFPDGSSIPMSTIAGTQTMVSGVFTFPYNGSTWQLAPQVNGVYQATQLSGLGSYNRYQYSQITRQQSSGDPLLDSVLMRGR